jgi:hypothetical protein
MFRHFSALLFALLLAVAPVSAHQGIHGLPLCAEFSISNVFGQTDVDLGFSVASTNWAVPGWNVGTINVEPASYAANLTQSTAPFNGRAEWLYTPLPPLSGQPMLWSMSYHVSFFVDDNSTGPVDSTEHTMFGMATGTCNNMVGALDDWDGFTKSHSPMDLLTGNDFVLQTVSGHAMLSVADGKCMALVGKTNDTGNYLSVNFRSYNFHFRQVATEARPCL